MKRLPVAAIVSILLLATPAAAEALTDALTALNASKCATRSLDDAVAACSVAIASGKYSGQDLSILYSNRGKEYRLLAAFDKALDDKALADFNKAIQLDPKNAFAFHNRCALYDDQEKFDQAIADCTEAVRLQPDASQNANAANKDFALLVPRSGYNPFFNRGIAWRGKNELRRAIADFTEAIKLDKSHDGAFDNRGMSFQALGEYDRAIADYSETIRLQPGDFRAYFNRGRTFAAKGDLERAIADYNESIKRFPDFNQLYRARGVAYYNLGKYSEAADELRHSLDITANAWVMLWRYLARARLSQNGAPELSKNAAKLDRNNWPYPAIEFFLGRRSLESMRAAAKQPLDKCQAEFYAGEWYSLHDKPADAKRAWQSAVDICERFDNFEYEGAVAQLKRFPTAPAGERETKTRTGAPASPSPQSTTADCGQAETHWKSAEAMGTRDVYEDHLKRFANCAFATLAKARIASLDQKGGGSNSRPDSKPDTAAPDPAKESPGASDDAPAKLTREDIVLVQTKMRALDYNVKTTGILDDQTRSAIRRLHADNDEPASDFVTGKQMARLRNTDVSSFVYAAIAGSVDGAYAQGWNWDTREHAEDRAMSWCRKRSDKPDYCTVTSRSSGTEQGWVAAVHCKRVEGRTTHTNVHVTGANGRDTAIDGAFSFAMKDGYARKQCKLLSVIEAHGAHNKSAASAAITPQDQRDCSAKETPSCNPRDRQLIDEFVVKAERGEAADGFCQRTGWPREDNSTERFRELLRSAVEGMEIVRRYGNDACRLFRVTEVHQENGSKCVGYDAYGCEEAGGCSAGKSLVCLDKDGKYHIR
jgi:tetratricopeptide (TPR) repeat protein